MSGSKSRTFKVGQEVEVTYRARVAEVIAGNFGAHEILRLEGLAGHDYASPPGGWVSPSAVNVKVISEPLPTEAGVYALEVDAAEQMRDNNFHTDGYQFYYRNTSGEWVDMGWGFPNQGDNLVVYGPPF